MKKRNLIFLFSLAVALRLTGSAQAATPLNANLLLNPGAEASSGAADYNTITPPAGWQTVASFTAVQYAAGSVGYIDPSVSTQVNGATNYFTGGPASANSSATQTIDVSDLATKIDGGDLAAEAAGFFGGYQSQTDSMSMRIDFRNGSGGVIGSFTIGNVTAAARGGTSGLLPRSGNAAVPSGTRSLVVTLLAQNAEGNYNDGSADNVSLKLVSAASTQPPPYPFSTGVDDDGQQLPTGGLDSHWTVRVPGSSTAQPASINYFGAWAAAPADANWLSPSFDSYASGPTGDYLYTTKFDLTGQNISQVTIAGKWACDNNGTEILLNGSSVGITTAAAAYGSLTDFTISSAAHFVSGVNTLTFHVVNTDGGDPNPTGLVVEFAPRTVPPVCIARPAGLVSLYSGDGNASDSAGNNNGAAPNGVTFAAGEVGRAFNLNGTTNFIRINDSPSLRPASVSIEGWFYFSAQPNQAHLVAKAAGSGIYDSYVLFFYGGTLHGAVGDATGVDQLDSDFTPQLNQWYHIAYTYNHAAGTHALYVDGVQRSSGATTRVIGYDNHPLLIGAESENESIQYFFPGRIDEVSIYNRGLSAAEVKSIHDAGTAGKCSPPAHEVTVTVPGTANLWLAGAGVGITASQGADNLNNAAPKLVPGLDLNGGDLLTFAATGGTKIDPNYPSSTTPDGVGEVTGRGPENGISAINNVPLDSLVGVFLNNTEPKTAPAGLTYNGTKPAGGLNYDNFQPLIGQVFFIGDGKNASGNRQHIVTPAGATRLYLGSMDQSSWYNNGGQFNVTVTGADPAAKNVSLILGQSASTPIASNGGLVRPGDIITYVLNVYNGGTAAATGVTVIDGLPAHTTFVSADSGGHLNKNKQVEFDLGTLAPGQANKKHLTIKARANQDAPLNMPLLNNNYGVFAENVPTVQGRDIVSTVVLGPVLVETSASSTTISPGGIITYTFTVRNQQTATANNVQVSFPLPEDAKLSSVTGPGAVVSSTDVTFKLGDVAPGASIKLTISLQLPYDGISTGALVLPAGKVTVAGANGQIVFFVPTVETRLVPGTAKPPQLGLIKIVPDGITLRQLSFLAAATGNDLFATFKKVFPAIDSSDGIDALAQIVNPDVSDSTDKDGDFVQMVTSPGQSGGPAKTFISYALIYTNATATVANNAFIQDRIAEGTVLVAGSAKLDGRPLPAGALTVTDNGRTLTFDVGALKAATHLITYKVRVLNRAEGGLLAGAAIQASGAFIGSSSLLHTSSSEPEETDVILSGLASAAIESYKITSNGAVGDVVGYDIFYHNTGNTVAGDFRIVDPIPAGTSFERAVLLETQANGQKTERGLDPSRDEKIDAPAVGSKTGSITYHLGPVPPGEFGYVRLQVKVLPAATTQPGLAYENKPAILAASFPQTSSRSVAAGEQQNPAADATTACSGADCSNLTSTISKSRVVDPNSPHLGIVIVAPLAVREGDTFNYLISLANASRTAEIYDVGVYVPIPTGSEFVSAEGNSGQGKTNVFFLGKDPQGNPAVVFPNPKVQQKEGQAPNVDIAAGQSEFYRVVLRAKLGNAGKGLRNPGMQTPRSFGNGPPGQEAYFRLVDPVYSPSFSTYVYGKDQSFESARDQVVTSALSQAGVDSAALSSRPDFKAHAAALPVTATTVVLGGLDSLPLNNGAAVVPLLNGNALAAGPQNGLVASGAGNLISQDGGSLVASGAGNLVKITNLISQDGGTIIGNSGSSLTTILSDLVASGAGNLVAQGAGNLVATGAGNLISQDGGSLISQDGGGLVPLNTSNLVASGAGNLVATGAGNLVATGAGNLVASGAGNLVASGAGNLVASGAGNVIATGGSNIVATGAGNRATPSGDNSTAASGTTSLLSSDASTAAMLTSGGLIISGGGNLPAR